MSTAAVRLGTGPVSWGVDFADAPQNPPWQQVLDEIAASGFALTELGPVGYLPEDPDRLGEELRRRGLGVAGSFLFQPLHDPSSIHQMLKVARRTCALISGVGGRFLVIIDEVSAVRAATAGRLSAAPRLVETHHDHFVDAVRRVSTLAREDFGLRPVLHNHVGTYLEFEDEIDAVLGAIEPELVGLCIDTGHAAYAGVDPVELFERYRDRVAYFHFKDVDPRVVARARERPMDFWSAISDGVFCPLGQGAVDFIALGAALSRHRFDGWATVEQDRDPHPNSEPLADVIASREFLEQVGIATHTEKQEDE
jgi:inosose dehydratase